MTAETDTEAQHNALVLYAGPDSGSPPESDLIESTGLALYDTMCRAISDCLEIDEVEDLRNKAKAMQEYHRQAQNYEAERMCREIRIRAERRCGELLKTLPVATGGKASAKSLASGNHTSTKRRASKTGS